MKYTSPINDLFMSYVFNKIESFLKKTIYGIIAIILNFYYLISYPGETESKAIFVFFSLWGIAAILTNFISKKILNRLAKLKEGGFKDFLATLFFIFWSLGLVVGASTLLTGTLLNITSVINQIRGFSR